MAAVISVLGTWIHLSFFCTVVKGVVLMDPWHRIYVTRRRSADTGQPWGWPILLFTMESHLTPFCVVNGSLMKSSWARIDGPAVSALNDFRPMKNWVSRGRSRRCAVSTLPWQYSPSRRGKKKAIWARSLMACWISVIPLKLESRD